MHWGEGWGFGGLGGAFKDECGASQAMTRQAIVTATMKSCPNGVAIVGVNFEFMVA